jgi:hypothetical protein
MKNKLPLLSGKNKVGADKMLSMYWFAIILLIALGLFSMVYIFYSAPYEVRDFESKILSEKVANCFSRQGLINPGVISQSSGGELGFNQDFNLLEECGLNFEVEEEYDWETEGQFFSEVEIYTLDDLNNPKVVYSGGNVNWKTSCFITGKKEENYDRLVKCRQYGVYVVDTNSNQYLISILVGVAKIEKNVRQ